MEGHKRKEEYQWNQWINCVIWACSCVCALVSVCIFQCVHIYIHFDELVFVYVYEYVLVWALCSILVRSVLLSVKIFRTKSIFPKYRPLYGYGKHSSAPYTAHTTQFTRNTHSWSAESIVCAMCVCVSVCVDMCKRHHHEAQSCPMQAKRWKSQMRVKKTEKNGRFSTRIYTHIHTLTCTVTPSHKAHRWRTTSGRCVWRYSLYVLSLCHKFAIGLISFSSIIHIHRAPNWCMHAYNNCVSQFSAHELDKYHIYHIYCT